MFFLDFGGSVLSGRGVMGLGDENSFEEAVFGGEGDDEDTGMQSNLACSISSPTGTLDGRERTGSSTKSAAGTAWSSLPKAE